jgi:redox-sensitive bicupin YhaK (pirin superfamily)
LEARSTAEIPGGYGERAIYVANGAIELGGKRLVTGQMAILSQKASSIRAIQPSRVMALGGEPIGERFLFWNFVSSSEDRLRQAREDWRAGRMKLPDADDREFIPLPDGPLKTPPAMP